ncbi:MAG TPA: PAS domain-containing protein [Stenotrophomonas sp.]|nr:PAS domain-containing protein [Stenotrophomonas sp.]
MQRELSRVVDRAIIDTVPGFVWQAGPDGSVQFLNQRWCDYTGASLEESLGIGWTRRIHPDDAAPLGAYWQALLEAGQPGSFEARLRRHDGVYRWFLIRAVPLLDEAGQVVSWYGQNTDIEDRKQAELLLAGEKHLLGLIAGGAPLGQVLGALCGLVQSTLEGALCSVVLVDPRVGCGFGDALPSVRLQPGAAPDVPAELVGEADGRPLDADASPVACCALSGESVYCSDLAQEHRWPAWRQMARAHGLHASWSIPIACSRGKAAGVISLLFRTPRAAQPADHSVIAQFTHLASIAIERARSEAALRQSEAFAAKAQRLSQTGTFSWRVDSDEMAWSEEVYRILDIDPRQAPTLGLICCRVHPEDAPAHADVIRRQRSATSDFEHGYRLLLPGGKVKWVHLVAHATRDPQGAVEYIAALQDVTQRHHAEEALGKVRSELAHVARVASLGALTASIAHEVNQPLAGIITNANTCMRMLAADPPNLEGARETVRRTLRDGNRASDVIKRLRALFAKKEATIEQFDLNQAAREVIAMLLGELQRHNVILHPDFDDRLPPVRGDRVQLQQVILNLLLNAADAMSSISDRPRDMRITTTADGPERVRLAVSDSGIGFDPQDAERLFLAFHTTKSTGMGIGLSVSRAIIESHGGTLSGRLNEGHGATFAFSLPYLQIADATAAEAANHGRDATAGHAAENA